MAGRVFAALDRLPSGYRYGPAPAWRGPASVQHAGQLTSVSAILQGMFNKPLFLLAAKPFGKCKHGFTVVHPGLEMQVHVEDKPPLGSSCLPRVPHSLITTMHISSAQAKRMHSGKNTVSVCQRLACLRWRGVIGSRTPSGACT